MSTRYIDFLGCLERGNSEYGMMQIINIPTTLPPFKNTDFLENATKYQINDNIGEMPCLFTSHITSISS